MALIHKFLFASTAIIAAAGAASAQTPICGGIAEDAPWIGGSEELSDISTSEMPLALFAAAIEGDGSDVRRFIVSETTDVRIEAQPVSGGDSVIELYDAAGTLVVTDDDSGGGLASRAELSLEAGEYCLLARGWSGSDLTTNLQVSRFEHEAITAGLSGGFTGIPGMDDGPMFVGIDPCTAETEATALHDGPIDELLLGEQPIAQANTIAEVPYYRFTIGSPQAVSIRAENESADPYIYIFDSTGAVIDENDDYSTDTSYSLNSRIDFTAPLEPGEYCIGMRALSDPDQPVEVSIMAFDEEAMLLEIYDSAQAAPPLDGSYPVTDLGILPPRLIEQTTVDGARASWFGFELSEGGVVMIDAIELTNSDPMLTLFDEVGTEIAFNDDAGGSLNSQIISRLTPGRYLLAVQQYDSGYNGIIRIVTERFVPATE